MFARRLTKQRLINAFLTPSQTSKQNHILPSQICNILILISTFSRKQGGKIAEHENDDIDAMLQEILDDDYQPISTHDVSEQSNTFNFSNNTGQLLVVVDSAHSSSENKIF